jgi:hypothetical protein
LPADAGGDSPKNLELPQIVGQLTILPKHWWQANEPRRDIAATTLESPLGSGPYRIKDFEPGRTITYEQVENYWAKISMYGSAGIILRSCVSSIFVTRKTRSDVLGPRIGATPANCHSRPTVPRKAVPVI